MVIVQHRSLRKPSGGRYGKMYRSKRQAEMGRAPANTTIGEKKVKSYRTLGGNTKNKLVQSTKVSVTDPKTKKTSITTLKTTLENPANLHFVRRNIITKGTIIDTEAGKAKVTSRPGQDGTINAVLV